MAGTPTKKGVRLSRIEVLRVGEKKWKASALRMSIDDERWVSATAETPLEAIAALMEA